MSKRKQNNTAKSNNKLMLIVAGILIIVVAAAAIFFLNNDTSPEDVATTVAQEGGLISPAEYQTSFSSEDHILIDVRTPQEFAAGHIAGAINIPVDDLNQRLSEIPTDETIVVYCRSGNRSGTATDILNNAGFNPVYDIDGGTIAWASANLPLE